MITSDNNGLYWSDVGVGPSTKSITVGSNLNRFLIVGVRSNTGGSDNTSGVTFNGVALAKLSSKFDGGRWLSLWYLANPTSGAHNIVITSSSTDYLEGHAVSLYSTSQTTPEASSTNNGSGTSGTISISTISAYAWAIGFIGSGTTNITFTNVTALAGETSGTLSTALVHRSDDPQANINTYALNWTQSSSNFAGIAISVAGIDTPKSQGGVF